MTTQELRATLEAIANQAEEKAPRCPGHVWMLRDLDADDDDIICAACGASKS